MKTKGFDYRIVMDGEISWIRQHHTKSIPCTSNTTTCSHSTATKFKDFEASFRVFNADGSSFGVSGERQNDEVENASRHHLLAFFRESSLFALTLLSQACS